VVEGKDLGKRRKERKKKKGKRIFLLQKVGAEGKEKKGEKRVAQAGVRLADAPERRVQKTGAGGEKRGGKGNKRDRHLFY